ncbi:hypothetical protein [Stenotrophomonas acidaminiphila]|uniref:hypothetical protein n=1 Tax=Stenotrophomonas acidaminiphila TaxID=128780 RepID=UPI0028A944FE|nr:hypothetical protein [Stenotrophomonas acidaminiphila]
MSRTPASFNLQVVRGATWEDDFEYQDEDGQPFDLAGYEARMQIRTQAGRYGLSEAETLVMELTTGNGRLSIPDPADGRVVLLVAAADTEMLNPSNERRVKLAYSVELYRPVTADPEYVIPLVEGSLSVRGEVTR